MAKGNMLLGFARGKVGDLVFTRRNGQQVTRPRVREVANPKTEGQQIQRMIFASVAAAYSRMRSITDHSFEGVKYGADSQARFMSENLKRLRAYYPISADVQALADTPPIETMAFALPNDRAQAGVGLIVSQGTLPAPNVLIATNGVFDGWGDGNVDVGATIAEVLASIGAVPGDQITIVALRDNGQFVKSRYVVDVNATAEQLAESWTPNGSAAAFDAQKTDVGVITLAATEGKLEPRTEDDDHVAAALIISRRDANGKWLRSPSVLLNIADEAPMYQASYALPYWQFEGTDIMVDDPRYLNNADI